MWVITSLHIDNLRQRQWWKMSSTIDTQYIYLIMLIAWNQKTKAPHCTTSTKVHFRYLFYFILSNSYCTTSGLWSMSRDDDVVVLLQSLFNEPLSARFLLEKDNLTFLSGSEFTLTKQASSTAIGIYLCISLDAVVYSFVSLFNKFSQWQETLLLWND